MTDDTWDQTSYRLRARANGTLMVEVTSGVDREFYELEPEFPDNEMYEF